MRLSMQKMAAGRPTVDMQWADSAAALLVLAQRSSDDHAERAPQPSAAVSASEPPVPLAVSLLASRGIRVVPLSDSAFGMEVTGLAPTDAVDPAVGAALSAVFLGEGCDGLLVIRGTPLTGEQLCALSARFGPLVDNPTERAKPREERHLLEGFPEILLLGTTDAGDYRPVFEDKPPPPHDSIQGLVRVSIDSRRFHRNHVHISPLRPASSGPN